MPTKNNHDKNDTAKDLKSWADEAERWSVKQDYEDEIRAEAKMSSIEKYHNTLAVTFKVLAWLALIVGAIMVFINLPELSSRNHSGQAALTLVTAGLSIGIGGFITMFAIGEVIQILHDIRRKLYEDE